MKVLLINGGGTGHDLIPAVKRILAAAGVTIAWEEHLAGGEAEAHGGSPLPPALLDSLRTHGLALKTSLLPSGRKPNVNLNVQLRRELGMFAAVRPLKNLKGLASRFDNVDLLVVREITEDLYAAIEHEIVPGVIQSLKVVTRTACERIFRFAFDWARAAGRKQIHCVHKANILKKADGLFLDSFREIAREYPEITAKEIIVDNCCMQLVSRPTQFDLLVMGNLYGDIVSDLGAGLVGGISATHGINVGPGVKIFEAFHGVSLDQAGKNRANPLPLLLPAVDLLDSLGARDEASRILQAIEAVLVEGRVRTADLGGTATTTQMTDAIMARL